MQAISLDSEFAQTWVDEANIHHLYTTCTKTVGSHLNGAIQTPESSSVRFCRACMDRLEKNPEAQTKFGLKWLLAGSITQADIPFAYNKDFDPANPEHFKTWLGMRPSHIHEAEWPILLVELKLMLKGLPRKEDRLKVMAGWKITTGLLTSSQ